MMKLYSLDATLIASAGFKELTKHSSRDVVGSFYFNKMIGE